MAQSPHIFMILADDYGWADAGWHRPAGYKEIQTPNLNSLVASGIELERHYVFKFCSPTRSALQSGRNPIHVNVNNYAPSMHNAGDPVSGFSAIPRNMTCMANVLKGAGYKTAMAGKWDAGMATPTHTPKGRGYDQSLFYFHHDNDYWTTKVGPGCPSNATGHSWHAYTKPPKHQPGDNFTYVVRDGYLAVGDDCMRDASNSPITVASAKALCAKNVSCLGFTFSDYSQKPTKPVKVLFKSAVHFVADTGTIPFDLWLNDAPAPASMRNLMQCSGEPYPTGPNTSVCEYEDEKFKNFLLQQIRSHAEANRNRRRRRRQLQAQAQAQEQEQEQEQAQAKEDQPLFVFWPFHIAHSPYQVPKAYEDKFAFIDVPNRRVYHAMASYMDDAVGELVQLLRAEDMWDRSLIVFSADNGGPITQAANNFPLHGGKHSNFDGGVRVNAFVSGGFLPAARRGTKSEALVGIWDWYSTFASLAGLTASDIVDRSASAAGLPPLDSVDQWQALVGGTGGPTGGPAGGRTELALGSCASASMGGDVFCQGDAPGATIVSGIVSQWPLPNVSASASTLVLAPPAPAAPEIWKLLVGVVALDCMTGPIYPNGTHQPCPNRKCGDLSGTGGCLYNLSEDPTESNDLLAAAGGVKDIPAGLLDYLRDRIRFHNSTAFTPNRGAVDPRACEAALGRYEGVWGPWLELELDD